MRIPPERAGRHTPERAWALDPWTLDPWTLDLWTLDPPPPPPPPPPLLLSMQPAASHAPTLSTNSYLPTCPRPSARICAHARPTATLPNSPPLHLVPAAPPPHTLNAYLPTRTNFVQPRAVAELALITYWRSSSPCALRALSTSSLTLPCFFPAFSACLHRLCSTLPRPPLHPSPCPSPFFYKSSSFSLFSTFSTPPFPPHTLPPPLKTPLLFYLRQYLSSISSPTPSHRHSFFLLRRL